MPKDRGVPLSCGWTTHTLPRGTHTSVLLGQVVRHLPVVIAVENAVGDADVVGCHLVDTLWDADDGWWGQGVPIGEAPLRSHGAGGRGVGRHGGWGASAPGRGEHRKTGGEVGRAAPQGTVNRGAPYPVSCNTSFITFTLEKWTYFPLAPHGDGAWAALDEFCRKIKTLTVSTICLSLNIPQQRVLRWPLREVMADVVDKMQIHRNWIWGVFNYQAIGFLSGR